MFKFLFKGTLLAIAIRLLDTYRRLSIQLLKVEVAKSYLHGVRLARLSAIGLMRMGLYIALIALGVLLLHAGLFILLPWSLAAKAVLGMILGLVYAILGGVALRMALDEGAWLSKSGAADMLKDALARSTVAPDLHQ